VSWGGGYDYDWKVKLGSVEAAEESEENLGRR
jgi:hypothetical protein